MRRKISLLVNPTTCDGRGLCAELFPERIGMDPWGYPIVAGEDIPPGLLDHAERATLSCPRMALHLIERRV
ncbi:MAG TPA: ferredoxin [Acidimicrobiales bacterium]|nr:ferredoxin [Acidimicrobiales bacterium]